MHRKITVEEPHKRSGPVQCLNCQEYGHTKAYCRLPAVCVICGELHSTAHCNKSKSESQFKKCSNCGGNHTANYRGCPVYSIVKKTLTQKSKISNAPPVNNSNSIYPPIQLPHDISSYANVLKNSQETPQNQNKGRKTSNPEQIPAFDFTRLENTIDTLVQTVNNFTNSMSNMMQEMLKMQSMLLQAVLNKP